MFPGEGGIRTLIKTGCEELLAPTISSLRKVNGAYCERVTKLQGGPELRWSAIHPSGGFVVLTARRLVKNLCFVFDEIVVDMECVEKLGLITVQSSHIPEPCTARDRASA